MTRKISLEDFFDLDINYDDDDEDELQCRLIGVNKKSEKLKMVDDGMNFNDWKLDKRNVLKMNSSNERIVLQEPTSYTKDEFGSDFEDEDE